LIASVGIGVMVVLLVVMGATAWWAVVTRAEMARLSQREQVNALGKAVAPALESMLGAGELSAVRRMMAEMQRAYGLSGCRIALPGGQVVADGEASKITLKVLPEKWQAGPVDGPWEGAESKGVFVRQPLLVGGRGPAMLEMTGTARGLWKGQWELAGGVGLISAGGLGCLLLIYRRARSKLVPLGLIREALLAIRNGERVKEALSIKAEGEPEAAAWNELIGEMGKLQERSFVEQVKESLGSRQEGRSDLSNACDALSQGMIILDEKSQVRYANGASAVFLQCKREEVLGMEAGTLIQNEEVKEAVAAALSGSARGRKTIEVERHDESGSGVFRFSIRPLRRHNGSSVLITIEDITQQCVAEASRNSFVAQATHELRTPLSNIRLYLETALGDGENDATLRSKCLNVINDESRRLERIVSEMLSVAEIEAGSLKLHRDDVRLDKLFEELEADYGAQAKDKDIAMKFDLPPKLPVIQADRDRLILAAHNLIGNALKYTPAGGKVTVTVKSENTQLVMEVADSGIGIEEQEQQLIFEKFYRSKDPRVGKITGSGLGLALAREVVRLHGGEITVRSELNSGSTFTLTLPVMKEAA